MTNYNERLDEILQKFALNQQLIGDQYGRDQINELSFELKDSEYRDEAKQAITSLIKELVADAKPKTMPSNLSPENYEKCERVVNQYHQNLLKALEQL